MLLTLLIEQLFNGLQLGVMLFLIATGLTLVLGIMRLLNLAHASFFMLGAYFLATYVPLLNSFVLAAVLSIASVVAISLVVEVGIFRPLYGRDHLDQVLATFALIMFFDEAVKIAWGTDALFIAIPKALSGQVEIVGGSDYPLYRIAVTAMGLAIGIALHLIIHRTRLGMLIRAGANNRLMTEALGIDVRLLYSGVFALGAALAASAGVMTAPIIGVQLGMGEAILIVTLVVIVIGGVGSVRGSLVAALLIGVFDTFSRFLMPMVFGFTAGSALSSMSIYVLMAVILLWRPRGLFPALG